MTYKMENKTKFPASANKCEKLLSPEFTLMLYILLEMKL